MFQLKSLPQIWPVTCHTSHVGQGSTFVAIFGDRLDGAKFILQALKQGAAKIVVKETAINCELQLLIDKHGAQLVGVSDPRQALGELSAEAWGAPAKKLKIIGVTGTKGKTTSVYALRHVLEKAGKKVAMLTGVENFIYDQKFPSDLTTPQPDYLHMFFAQCVKAGVEYVVMEVSAQALSLHRVAQLEFAGIIFTNLEMEHSEFYSDIETYFAAKCQIFKLLAKTGFAILNVDDVWVQKILVERPCQQPLISFGQSDAQYKLEFTHQGLLQGVKFGLHDSLHTLTVHAQNISGIFNVYNLAGVALAALNLGLSPDLISASMLDFAPAPGRLEIYQLPNGARGVIDYAHTPSSFRSILGLLRCETDHLILVFGAGGGRDPLKRPIMGEIATQFCDVVILTNDNPRHENPRSIIQQIIGGQSENRFIIQPDRALAIKLAYQKSTLGSIIVLLGKGPDEYQQFGEEKYFFSDRQSLLSCY